MDRIGCSYVASCKRGMTAAKIRSLFAVLVCVLLFSIFEVSLRAPRARRTTVLNL